MPSGRILAGVFPFLLLLAFAPAASALEVHDLWTHRYIAYGWSPPAPSVVEGRSQGTLYATEPIDIIAGGAGLERISPTSFRCTFTWDAPPVWTVFQVTGGTETATVWVYPRPRPTLEPGAHAFPIVNLSVDLAGLWSPATGLLVWGDHQPNWDQEGSAWERDAGLSIWDAEGAPILARTVGLRINGGWTRCLPQKSLRLYFDHHDQPEEIVHDLFGDGPTVSRRLLLRQTMWAEFLLKDHWATAIFRDLGHLSSRWTPAIGYLNGEYFGIYGLRERLDDEWATVTLGFDPDDVVVVKDGEPEHGDPDAWPSFLAWVDQHPQPAAHDFFVQMAHDLDLRAYTDWLLINGLAGSGENGSFHNLVLVRDPEGRWHHTMWDEDNIIYWENVTTDLLRFFAAGDAAEYEAHRPPMNWFPPYEESRLYCRLFRQLMHNAQYRTLFAARVDTLLNGPLSPTAACARLDSVAALFQPELATHAGRFAPTDLNQLASVNSSYKSFLTTRWPLFAQQAAAFRADFLAPVELSAFTARRTALGVNLAWRTERERGNRGFRVYRAVGDPAALVLLASFETEPGLEGAMASDDPREYALADAAAPADVSLWYQLRHVEAGGAEVAHPWLEVVPGDAPPLLVVNEFMADNDHVVADEAGQYDDWLELHNPGPDPLQLAGLYLTDDLAVPQKWALPAGMLPPGGFLLVWCDEDQGQGPYHANFKLSVDGEAIGLFAQAGGVVVPVDTLTFGPQTTDVSRGRWPDAAPHWQFFASPTPGASNEIASPVPETASVALTLHGITPNPADDQAAVRFSLAVAGRVTLEVYDLRGRRVRRVHDGALASGPHVLTWNRRDDDGRAVPGGVYLVRLSAGAEVRVRKVGVVR